MHILDNRVAQNAIRVRIYGGGGRLPVSVRPRFPCGPCHGQLPRVEQLTLHVASVVFRNRIARSRGGKRNPMSDEKAPSVLHAWFDKLYAYFKDKFWTWFGAAVAGALAAVGVWLYSASVVILEKDERLKLAEVLGRDEAFAEMVATLSGTPVGSVVAWPAAVEPPTGWEVCAGQEVDATTDARIWKVLGTTYGKATNGKVRLPDFQGYFLRGATTDKSRDPGLDSRTFDSGNAGVGPGTKQMGSVIDHVHESGKLRAPIIFGAGILYAIDAEVEGRQRWKARSSASVNKTGSADESDPQNNHVRDIPITGLTGNVVPGEGETRPKNYAVHWIIRVK